VKNEKIKEESVLQKKGVKRGKKNPLSLGTRLEVVQGGRTVPKERLLCIGTLEKRSVSTPF